VAGCLQVTKKQKRQVILMPKSLPVKDCDKLASIAKILGTYVSHDSVNCADCRGYDGGNCCYHPDSLDPYRVLTAQTRRQVTELLAALSCCSSQKHRNTHGPSYYKIVYNMCLAMEHEYSVQRIWLQHNASQHNKYDTCQYQISHAYDTCVANLCTAVSALLGLDM